MTKYIVKNEDGRFWSSYDSYEEANDAASELNSELDCLDNQWCVYKTFIDEK